VSVDDDTLARLQRYVDAHADSEVASLVKEAEIEARSNVRAILVEALAERLLERAAGELASPATSTPSGASARDPVAARPPHPTPPPSRAARAPERAGSTPASDEREQELALYVYGVVFDGATLQPTVGIDEVHRLTTIEGEGIAAVASRVPLEEFGEEALQERREDLTWLEQKARLHEQIVAGIREQQTLVPMRLCTIYRAERSVEEMLAREHEFLLDALLRLDGRKEWGVKLLRSDTGAPTGDDTSVDPVTDVGDEPIEDAGDPSAGGPGQRYLSQRRSQQQRRAEAGSRVQELCASVHERLASLAVEAKVNPLQPRELTKREEQMLLNGVYLVDDAMTGAFEAAIAELQNEHSADGLIVELTGPWPPYNFVNNPAEVGR
jgi:hypothetical protein